MRKLALHWQILIAIVLAAVVGSIVKHYTTDAFAPGMLGVSFVSVFEFVGAIFLNALKMIIVPLITSSIIVGVAGIGSGGNIGALGVRTLLFYAVTTLAAILIGLIAINIMKPGYVDGKPAGEILALEAPADDISERIEGKGAGDVVDLFKRLVPPNIVKAAAEGQMLGLIFFSILFGYFMTRLSHDYAEPLFNFWNGVFNVMMHMTEFIMKFAPIGANFALAVLLALLLHSLITLPLLLRFIGRVKPFATMRAMSPALLTAFSTSSSSATLPVTMDTVEEKVGVSNQVSSFVLPLGATVNMNGTALYECAAAMFLAQAYGLELSFGVQFTIVTIALVTSIGVAGVPSASLVAIAIILAAVGLPVEAIGVLLVFDRVLDMCRTSVNVWGDACCATIIARLRGEKTNVAVDPR
ncbi:MAG: dicarboxylate/amino acid:cation symporter [Methyloceanibacter sp.]